MFLELNLNPMARRVGDCAVRAVALALDVSWEDAFGLLADAAFSMCDMPSSDAVWGAVLRQHGFYRAAIPNSCPDCYTAEDFCRDHRLGIFVLGFGNHVATVGDGVLFDSWDSSQEIPQYYWFRKDGGIVNEF